MNWFKMLWLTSEEREILKRAKEAKEKQQEKDKVPSPDLQPAVIPPPLRSYKNIIFSNGNITVVFDDGVVLDKMGVDKDFLQKVREAKTQKEIEDMMINVSAVIPPPPPPCVIETEEEKQIVQDNLDVLRKHKDFVIEGDKVCMKGVSLPIPTIVLASFIEILEKQEILKLAIEMDNGSKIDHLTIEDEDLFDQYHALKMFWLKLALNPLPQSREDLLVFCRNNNVRITNNGNLVLYRRIVSLKGADKTYVSFVSQSYYSLKKKGEDVRNYAVGRKPQGTYYFVNLEDNFVEKELIGNLQVLYWELPNYETNRFTSAHDNKVSIKVGGVYSIPEDKINLNNGICAAGGLHAAAVDYNYSGFGDTPVVVLVNPCKAITVPRGEIGKLRTTEMFIACVNNKPQGTHFDEDALVAFDEEYHSHTLDELELAAAKASLDTLAVKDNLPPINLVDLTTITNMLKNRVTIIS